MANIFPRFRFDSFHTPRGGFSPDQISGLELWFDGKAAATFTLNGTKVITWADKSGNSRDVTNAVDAQRPTWDSATGRLTFTSVDSTYLKASNFVAITQPITIIYVCKNVGGQGGDKWYFDGGTGYFILGTHLLTYYGYAGTWLSSGGLDGLDNRHMIIYNGVSSYYYINNVAQAGPLDIGALTLDGITLGARYTGTVNYADLEVMEILAYSKALTADERTNIDDYITNKWGL